MDWPDLLQRCRPDPAAAATDAALAEAEARLGIALPPGYRAFLLTSNGFGPLALGSPPLRPVGRIGWFLAENQDAVKIYGAAEGPDGRTPDEAYFAYDPAGSADYRPEHLRHALQISDVEDTAVLLLNPQVIDAAGEWEAWFLSNWNPGVTRYRSFAAMVLALAGPEIDLAGLDAPAPPPGLPDEYRGGPGTAGRRKVRREKPQTLEQSIKALWSPSPAKRRGAAARLGRSGDARAVGPLADAMRRSDPLTREWAALALGTLGDPAGVAPLLAALDEEDGCLATMAIHALGDLGDAQAVEPLLARLDLSGEHRAVASFALAKFDDPRAVDVLTDQLAASADVTAARFTGTLLANHGPRGLDRLADAASHPSAAVRGGAAKGLYNGLFVADHARAADALRRLAADAAQALAILRLWTRLELPKNPGLRLAAQTPACSEEWGLRLIRADRPHPRPKNFRTRDIGPAGAVGGAAGPGGRRGMRRWTPSIRLK